MAHFDDYRNWFDHMRHTITATMIANQATEHMLGRLGAPGPEDMRRFIARAVAVSELWQECVDPERAR